MGASGCRSPEFVLPSPYLNLLLYPKPLRFKRRTPLDPEKFVYLDGCVREESEAYEVPTFKTNSDKPLIYFSYGSLGVSDVDLIKRIIGVLADAPYRVLVNVGDYVEQYDAPPDNMQIASWYRQTAVLPHVDVFIQHGGNNSFNESLYFGIPPIVMPFVWDGHDNAQRVNDTNHGIGMHRYDLDRRGTAGEHREDAERPGNARQCGGDKRVHAGAERPYARRQRHQRAAGAPLAMPAPCIGKRCHARSRDIHRLGERRGPDR